MKKLDKFKSEFEERLSDYLFMPKENKYGNSESYFVTHQGLVILSFQATSSQETNDSLRRKIIHARRENDNLIPVFLARSGFIFPYEGSYSRVRNVGENTNDIYGVNSKAKIIANNQNGRLLVYKTYGGDFENGVLQIHQTSIVSGKSNRPNDVGDIEWEKIRGQKKFQKTEIKRALHFNKSPQKYYSLERFIQEFDFNN